MAGSPTPISVDTRAKILPARSYKQEYLPFPQQEPSPLEEVPHHHQGPCLLPQRTSLSSVLVSIELSSGRGFSISSEVQAQNENNKAIVFIVDSQSNQIRFEALLHRLFSLQLEAFVRYYLDFSFGKTMRIALDFQIRFDH